MDVILFFCHSDGCQLVFRHTMYTHTIVLKMNVFRTDLGPKEKEEKTGTEQGTMEVCCGGPLFPWECKKISQVVVCAMRATSLCFATTCTLIHFNSIVNECICCMRDE